MAKALSDEEKTAKREEEAVNSPAEEKESPDLKAARKKAGVVHAYEEYVPDAKGDPAETMDPRANTEKKKALAPVTLTMMEEDEKEMKRMKDEDAKAMKSEGGVRVAEKKVQVRPLQEHDCHVAGERYKLHKDVVQEVPLDVATILQNAGVAVRIS